MDSMVTKQTSDSLGTCYFLPLQRQNILVSYILARESPPTSWKHQRLKKHFAETYENKIVRMQTQKTLHFKTPKTDLFKQVQSEVKLV
jgi:hypothetical protein